MPSAISGTYTIYYEVAGPVDGAPLLLVPGLGAQLTSWDDGFVDLLVGAGFRVVRFDNRDIGLSSRTDGDPPDMMALFGAAMSGSNPPPVPYTLSDMAGDASAVLDDLGIDRAHVAGMSLGGMIAQTMAVEYPERVRTLTSIMSVTGDPAVGAPEPEAITALLSPMPADREEAIERTVHIMRVIGGPHFDEDTARLQATASYDRSVSPLGAAFQFAAMVASGDRTERLRDLDLPVLVIHGRGDPLITVSGGEATADAIPGSKLVIYDDMAHDMPPALWPQMVGEIGELAGVSVA